jgi:hypothetical protein
MKYLKLLAVALLHVFLISSCGGNGGGGGGGTTPPGSVQITKDNAEEVTGKVVSMTAVVNNLGTTSAIVTGAVVQPSDQRFDLAGFAEWQLLRLVEAQDQLVSGLVTGVVAEITVQCDNGGSITVRIDDADNNQQPSSGDTLDIRFNNCFTAQMGVTLNGEESITDLIITGNPQAEGAPFSLKAVFTLKNLRVGAIHTIDGAFSFSESTEDGITFTESISTKKLTVTRSVHSTTLSDFEQAETFNKSTGAYSRAFKGMLTSTKLKGKVTFEMLENFQGLSDDFPSTGVMLIKGNNNSSVKLTAIDDVFAQLEVDENGDGIVDHVINTTWQGIINKA